MEGRREYFPTTLSSRGFSSPFATSQTVEETATAVTETVMEMETTQTQFTVTESTPLITTSKIEVSETETIEDIISEQHTEGKIITEKNDPFFDENWDEIDATTDMTSYDRITESDIPRCDELSDIEIEFGEECREVIETIEAGTRDLVLEKFLSQLWISLNGSDVNRNGLPFGLKVDPLDISNLLPGGSLHVDEEGSYYAADLWMWNITMTGLTQAYLNEIRITRNEDLSKLNVEAEFRLDSLSAVGLYNVTGWLGWSAMTLDSGGDQPWQAKLVNCSLVVKIVVDAEADCDEEGDAKITELDIPLVYETIVFNMEKLDKSFDTVIQGILVMVIKAQNMVAVSALRSLISSSISTLMCPEE